MTEIARVLRIMRIERGEVLKNMADKLGMTTSYLSAIECGKRKIPEDLILKLNKAYNLTTEETEKIETAKAKTENHVDITIPLTNLTHEQQDVALKFARSFKNTDSVDISNLIEKMKSFMKDREEK